MTDFQLLRRLRNSDPKTPPTSPPATGAPRLSEKAAMVAQQMESLETELTAAINHSQDMENRAAIAEQQLAKTEDKLNAMQTERDYFQRRYIETNAKLRAGAGVILDCIRESEKDLSDIQEKDAFKPKPEAQRTLARALAGEDDNAQQPPLPGFLSREQGQ